MNGVVWRFWRAFNSILGKGRGQMQCFCWEIWYLSLPLSLSLAPFSLSLSFSNSSEKSLTENCPWVVCHPTRISHSNSTGSYQTPTFGDHPGNDGLKTIHKGGWTSKHVQNMEQWSRWQQSPTVTNSQQFYYFTLAKPRPNSTQNSLQLHSFISPGHLLMIWSV